ncbi:hypothetical protein OAD66_02365 [Bacteroidia bacterium]|nr:hypothetical protein [Bacteroidia bacterium]
MTFFVFKSTSQKVLKSYNVSIALSLLLLSSCSITKTNKKSYQPAQLISIEALDPSEDKSVLSTHNDEVMVSIFFGTKLGDKWFFNGYNLPTLIFDSSAMLQSITDVQLRTTDECSNCEVWICLTEIDDDNSEDRTNNKLLNHINTNGYQSLDSKADLDALITDNDFLGVVKIPYFTNRLDTNYTIKGFDLLDKYEYKIKISRGGLD